MEKLKLDILSSLGATFVLTPFTMLFFTFLIDCDHLSRDCLPLLALSSGLLLAVNTCEMMS